MIGGLRSSAHAGRFSPGAPDLLGLLLIGSRRCCFFPPVAGLPGPSGAAKRARPTKLPALLAANPAPLHGGLAFGINPQARGAAQTEKPAKPKRQKMRNDPKFVSAARELRDRWLEKVNENPNLLGTGKYDLSRRIESNSPQPAPLRLIQAA